MKLHTVNTELFKLDGGAMFGVVPKSIWNKFNPADENNMCSWAMRCMLIEDNGRLVLIDNGIGDKQDAKFFSYYFLHGEDTLEKSLNNLGFTKADITDVILTHLHFDHCGGSIDRVNGTLVPAFKNAIYWSNELHWKWATEPNDREKASFLKENILPIQQHGQLQFIAQPATALQSTGLLPSVAFNENISILFVNGHTGMMMLPQINYNGKTIVFVADLLPAVDHLPVPYVMAYDMFPLTSMHEKKSFLAEAVENDYVLFFEHDPINECCTLKQTEKGVRRQECFQLSAIS